MNLSVRDGNFDVTVLAGPRATHWPSIGPRTISGLCADLGLQVGVFGGEHLRVRGVIPLPGTGGVTLVEDLQKRIHRIQARAIVRIGADPLLPDPFDGWRSQGLIPISTAERLRAENQIRWDPCTVLLGTGNRALRFGSSLLESGVAQVFCVESRFAWGAKRFAGWEVERRRFEMAGGKIVEAVPISLKTKAALLWELRWKDAQGIRVIEAARVVTAGPFGNDAGVREHPPGSLLFELEQSSPAFRAQDVEGWALEETRALWLATKISRALIQDLGPRKEEIDRLYRRSRGRMKRYLSHRENPFTPTYQGKWTSPSDTKMMRAFRGVPQVDQKKRLVASIECFEDIPCNLCQQACPENAIEIGRVPRTKDRLLIEDRCTACGACLVACPSAATSLFHEREEQSLSKLVLSWRGALHWKVGDFATLLNRKGESLASARVTALPSAPASGLGNQVQLVELEVPTHLVFEARALRRPKATSAEDRAYLEAVARSESAELKAEIFLNGEKRLVREKISVSAALFEIGQSRAEDILLCPDGSCNLCHVEIDGVKKLGCQNKVRRGMSIKTPVAEVGLSGAPTCQAQERVLCACLGITVDQVVDQLRQGSLQSPEAVLSTLRVGEGKCHGQLCSSAFKRLLLDEGIDASQWIDWRFPWSEWVLNQS